MFHVCSNPKGLGVASICRNLLYTPLESGFTGKSLTILDFVRGSFLRQFRIYTPLESGFTGKSLTIPDFVRGTLFRNVCREFVTTIKVGHFAKNAFLPTFTGEP